MSPPWILIPVHNRRALTLGCLRHLQAIGELEHCHVVVIDDGSIDGTADAIRREFPGGRILAGNGQLWWTGAIALGMAEADRAGASAVVWLNDDCLPERGAIARLIARATQGPPALVGPVCQTETGAPVSNAFRGRVRHHAPATGETERTVDGLSGFCVAVPRRVWTEIGFPDAARFPHYYGDTAYTWRARRAGFSVVLDGAARVRLVAYRERAHTIAEYRVRMAAGTETWSAVFTARGSPFRATSQWHYLRLRHGRAVGTVLAAARLLRWQLAFIAAATVANGKSAADR